MIQTIPQTTDMETQEIPSLSRKSFEQHLERYADLPDWFLNLKKQQWEVFESLPMPKRRDEAWRFSNTKLLNLESLSTAIVPADHDSLMDRSYKLARRSGRLVVANGTRLGSVELDEELVKQGVIWASLTDAARSHPDLVKESLLDEGTGLGADKFHALNLAMSGDGTFLYVPPGVSIDKPLVVYNWACSDEGAFFDNTVVVVGDNAKVSVVEIFESEDKIAKNFVCSAAHIFAGVGARVTYEGIQNWNTNTRALHLNTANACRDSNIRSININLGASFMRHEHHTRVAGVGSNVETYSLSVPTKEQIFDQRTLQTHSAPHSRSDLLFKNALFDHSKTIFSGLIKVEEDAQQTDAYQTNRNLLLSETAEANSLPGLEINANDVKCSHGATSGRLDETNLFYFLARGIPTEMAQELMVFGFFEEILERLDNEELAELVRTFIRKEKFNKA